MQKRHGRRFRILTALIVALCAAPSWAKPRTEVRLRLKRQLSSVNLSGFAMQIAPPSGYIHAATDEGLTRVRVSLKSPSVWQVEWASGRVQTFETHRLSVQSQMLRLNTEPVPYEVELTEGEKGIDVVTRLDLDSYLAGVLPAEMPLSWPLEALKAQTVAARSYVLKTMYERRDQDFDVDSTIIDQVYKFSHDESMRADWKEKLNQAIEQTRGEVLTDDNGRILKAFYHADCGCQTEDPKFVWGESKSFVSVRDPTCGKRKTYQWSLSLAWQEVQNKLKDYFTLPTGVRLSDLSVASRTPSGRVALLAANFNLGGKEKVSYTINAQNFRKIFGFQKVASSNFTMHKGLNRFQLDGQGLGHGVGLCQWGAKALAKSGADYRAILKSFYPKAKFHSPRRA